MRTADLFLSWQLICLMGSMQRSYCMSEFDNNQSLGICHWMVVANSKIKNSVGINNQNQVLNEFESDHHQLSAANFFLLPKSNEGANAING